MLSKRVKSNAIKNVQKHETDTGSAEVQIGIISRQIEELSLHLKKHKQDQHSRRGLLQMVSKRRTLLQYLKKSDEKGYKKLIKKLGLE